MSFPDLLWTKPKARSGQVRMILFFDWPFNLPFRDARAEAKIARSNDGYYYATKRAT